MATEQFDVRNLSGAVANRILVVEDDRDEAQSLKALLEAHNYEALLAKDGGQAHSMFVMRKPDFVILDLILPGESGFEICERMKQTDEAIPVLVVTAIDMDEARDLAARVGADGYLTKPFDPQELLERIRSVAEEVWARFHLDRPKEKERVRFNCRCGKRFKVSAVHRGRTLTCPDCNEPIIVPRHN